MNKFKIPKLGNYESKNLKPKPLKEPKKMNWIRKTWGALKRTLGGKNKTGEIVHGVLDLLPFPNQIIAKLFEEDVERKLSGLFTWRNGIALVVTVLILFEVITIDQLYRFFDLFEKIANILNSLL